MKKVITTQQGCRKCPNVRMRFGETFINTLKTENKWEFLLTREKFHKHQNKLIEMWKEKIK